MTCLCKSREYLQSFRILDVRKCGCLAPGFGRFTLGKCLVPTVQKAESACGQVWTTTESLPPPPQLGFDPFTIQLVASRYTGHSWP
jgi:hypothetical protein